MDGFRLRFRLTRTGVGIMRVIKRILSVRSPGTETWFNVDLGTDPVERNGWV
jgi:hypothetical protein